jgi:signal transduction histidine kinase/DNA-binding response OmpR family regulator
MAVVVMLSLASVVYYWAFIAVPTLKQNEQSEAELLITPYTQILEEALDNGNNQKVENVLNQLALIKSPIKNEPLVAGIRIELTGGRVFERVNKSAMTVSPFVAQTPLFSPSTMNLLGSVRLEYSDAYYQRITHDMEFKIIWAIVIAALMLVLVQAWVRRLLKPLNDLSNTLGSANLDTYVQLPNVSQIMTSEVRQVWQAVDQLFKRLRQRDNDVAEEHAAAQTALREKLEAEAASREKSRFLANMSHELRTPLNAIIGYSEMLSEDAEERKDDVLAKDLKRIRTAGRHLLSLINDVLDLSKIEAGKAQLYLEDIKLPELIRDVVDTVRPLININNNEFVVSCDDSLGSVRVDIPKFRQALINILGNAAKFTQNGRVVLSVDREASSASGAGPDWIVIYVKDTGIGISKSQQKKLFTAFTQADNSTTREYGGTGLGLAISRSVCRLMGGDLAVSSEHGKGSVFCMRIPAQVTANNIEPADTNEDSADEYIDQKNRFTGLVGEQEERRRKVATILVIDDDSSVGDLLKRKLSHDGFKVVVANNGELGLEIATELKPDLILLDILITDIIGWHVLTQLKKDSELKHIPVIMHSVLDERGTAFSLGASDYLAKPATTQKLLEVVFNNIRKPEGASILVIDDDVDTRRLIKMVFENEGWHVIEEVDGRLGLIRVAENHPSAIVLDLNMPRMSGEEFLESLGNNPEFEDIPVIALTAKDLTEDEKQNLLNSVDMVIEKGPQSLDLLLGRLRKLIDHKYMEAV